MLHDVHVLLTRCFVQREIHLAPGVLARPLPPAGMRGEITYARDTCSSLGIPFNANTRNRLFQQFAEAKPGTVLIFSKVESQDPRGAIEAVEREIERACGVLSFLSACPVVPVCAVCYSDSQLEMKFFPPKDPIIVHGTNVPGYLDTVPYLFREAKSNRKLAVLLRLFRSAQYEEEIDYQILHYLILLEEASDSFEGTLAQRIRLLFKKYELVDYVNNLPKELKITVPSGNDFIDVLVKLRNAAAHDGEISAATVNAKYVEPFVANKEALAKLIREVVRVTLASMAGAGPSQMAKRIELKPGEKFTIVF